MPHSQSSSLKRYPWCLVTSSWWWTDTMSASWFPRTLTPCVIETPSSWSPRPRPTLSSGTRWGSWWQDVMKWQWDDIMTIWHDIMTWHYEVREQFRGKAPVIFLLGTTSEKLQHGLREEHYQFNDIIQIDVVDSYTNLPYKTIFSFIWINRCVPVRKLELE